MEFLVRSENRSPVDTPAERREELPAGERARAMELRAAGVLERLWRVPGPAGAHVSDPYRYGGEDRQR